jgi:hypothetical protein
MQPDRPPHTVLLFPADGAELDVSSVKYMGNPSERRFGWAAASTRRSRSRASAAVFALSAGDDEAPTLSKEAASALAAVVHSAEAVPHMRKEGNVRRRPTVEGTREVGEPGR